MDYKDAGVDIQEGERFAERIARKVRSTYGERVVSGVGGFAGLYRSGDKLLAAGVDGVGTKLVLAQELGIHHTIGIDLVAMCINDILCTGARPLFFMDYLATGKLDVRVADAIVDGIIEGCRQSECALLGGETAEMPGVYGKGVYDLAGMALGELSPEDLLGGDKVKPGQGIIALASSGFHSNGYSLLRKFVDEESLKKELLTPTRIYWETIKALPKEAISALAHITGGGLYNIPRMSSKIDYKLESLPAEADLPRVMRTLLLRMGLSWQEACRTFNMGVGMVLTTERPDLVVECLEKRGESYWILGETRAGSGKLILPGTW